MSKGHQPWGNMTERHLKLENSLYKGPVVGSKMRNQSGWTDCLEGQMRMRNLF